MDKLSALEESLDTVAKEKGGKIFAVIMDVNDSASVKADFEETERQLGYPDIVCK